MNRLLLVDGSNMMMRAAFGGELTPTDALPIATGLIRRAARQAGASHMIVALDSSAPSWRKLEFPDYKANRSVDTDPWLRAAYEHWLRLGWYVEDVAGFEADDVIATLAKRAAVVCPVSVLSNDSDLLSLTDVQGVEVLKPMNGGVFSPVSAQGVCIKYDLKSPALLTDYKALTGEKGDNIPGVPGIGPVKAARLLRKHLNLEMIIACGLEGACKESKLVAEHREVAERAFRLVSLRFDAPISPVKPHDCRFQEGGPNV
jgi:DNA polymerase-1